MGRNSDVSTTRLDPMTDPSDSARLWLTVLFAAWIMAFAYSAFAFVTTPSDAANRSTAFLGWQGVAGIIAVAIFGIARQWPKRSAVRNLAAVPMSFAALLIIVVIGMAFWTGAF